MSFTQTYIRKGDDFIKVAIYSRKSVYIEGSMSIETQVNMCKEYMTNKYNGCTFEVFEDEGFSGKNTNRPAFQRLLKKAELKQIDIVVCYKVDRIARNTLDFLQTLDLLTSNNISLISISEGFDPNTQIGKMMLTLLASFAEMERANTQDRVRDNMLSLAKKGKWTGGSAPTGYKIAPSGGLALANEGLILDTYEMKYKKHTNAEIISYVYNKYKHKFQNETLSSFLKKPIYVKSSQDVSSFLKNNGYTVLGNEDNIHGYLTYSDKNTKYAVVSNDIVGIVNSDIWVVVNKDIANKNSRGTNRFNKNYWLTKTLVCPICGKTYAGHTKNWSKTYTRKDGSIYKNSNTYHYYMCRDMLRGKLKECTNNKRVNQEYLENKVETYIYMLKDRAEFDSLYSVNVKSNISEIKKLNKILASKEKNIENLIEKLSLLSTDASALVIKKIEEMTNEISNIKNIINELKLEDLNNVKSKNKDSIFNAICCFDKKMSVDEKRQCAMIIFNRIIYEPISDTFEVHFN